MSREPQVGDRIKDNDPRCVVVRILYITQILPNGVRAKAYTTGRTFDILRRRIHTDGKPRKSGFTLMEPKP